MMYGLSNNDNSDDLSVRQGPSSIASLLKWDFLYSCAAAYDKISTDIARRAVPLL